MLYEGENDKEVDEIWLALSNLDLLVREIQAHIEKISNNMKKSQTL